MGFGDFAQLCEQTAIPLCNLLGPPSPLKSDNQPLLSTTCQARALTVANTIIFSAASDFAHIAALLMSTVMVLHVRSKFTAVGRREILTFFYIYMLLTCFSLVLDAGVIQETTSGAFPYFVAVQNGLIGALAMCLMVNGFVGFQLYEDGTTLSVWMLRGSCVGMFIIEFAVSLLTVKKGWSQAILFSVLYIIPALFLFIYVAMQVFLVLNTLQDRWPLGDLAFGSFFFIVGQVIMYALGKLICQETNHYLDPLFFATICNLLAVMMVYKYWDSITKEDLEFSVGTKPGSWEVRDPLMAGMEEEHFDPSQRHSFYKGGNRNSFYETTTSLDYNPRPASSHNYIGTNTRLPTQPYSQLNDNRQSYGDVRKSAAISSSRLSSAPTGMYDEFDNHQHQAQTQAQPYSSRDRSKGRPNNRISSEGGYERY